MKVSFWLSTFGFGLLLTLITSQLTSVAAVPKRIITRLEEAMSATTMDVVDEKLDEADKWINKARGIDEIERDFIIAHIKQIRGRIYMTRGQHLKDINIRDKGYDWLRLASDDYERLVQKCEERPNQSRKRRKNLPSDSKRLQKIERDLILAKYKWAWAEYYVADASDQQTDRKNRFNSALEKFREFTEEGDPNKPLIADCFICQAQCLYELEDYSEIVELLDPEKFKPENIKSKDKEEIKDIFKRTIFWRMKAYQATSSHKKAEDSAKQYFDTLPENSKLDTIELEMMILRIRSLGALINNDESLRTPLNELRSLIKPYGDRWRTKLAEELLRIGIKTSHSYLSEANRNLNARNFKEALDNVETGLKEANAEEELCANLRHVKFVACWRLNQWRQAHIAAKDFLENHPKDSRATEVCGLAIKSGLKSLKSDPPLETESFLKFLENAEKNFPENSKVEMIPWYKGYILFQDGQYSASQKILKTIESSSPVYRRAQHCLATSAYKQAKTLIEAGENKQDDITILLGDTVDALDRFVSSNLPEEELQLALHAVTLTIETSRCLLNLKPPDPNTVLAFIERMQPLQNKVHQSEDQWLAQCIKANILAGDINSSIELIEKLIGKATIANPLIDISKLLEQTSASLVENNRSTDAARIDKKLIEMYKALLLQHIGENKAMRDREPSVHCRLAQCYIRLRKYSEAIEHFELYMKNELQKPPPSVIRDLATAYEQTKNYKLVI